MEAMVISGEARTEPEFEAALQRRQMDALVAEVDRLNEEMKEKDRVIEQLRKTNRAYRKQHLEAYGKYLAGQREDQSTKGARWQRYMVAFTLGMVSIMALTMMAMVIL